MSQICYECGHETPYGKPLEHFAVCVMVNGQLNPEYVSENTSKPINTATTFPPR